MNIPETIGGLPASALQAAFKEFLDIETPLELIDNQLVTKPKTISPAFLSQSLSVSNDEAVRIHAVLMKEEWICSNKQTPTFKGMALAQQQLDRPKISRDEGFRILEEAVVWAERVNADVDARVRVKKIDLFGSLLKGAQEVGDVDLFVSFTSLDLIESGDFLPEDHEREEELAEELPAISEYLSLHSWIDSEYMSGTQRRQVFPMLRDE